jgi:hypothetical protein
MHMSSTPVRLYYTIEQLSSQIQVSEHPAIRECLQEDESTIAALLEGLLSSDMEMSPILALRGDDAHSFLNLLQFVRSTTLMCEAFG